MQQMKQTKSVPYKTESEKPIHTYEVLDNGELKIVQVTTVTSWWKTREFISLIREHEDALKLTEDNLSDEYKEKMIKQKKELEDELEKFKPLREDSEVKAKIAYEKLRLEGLVKNLKIVIEDKEINTDWFQNVWFRVKGDLKKQVLESLTNEERGKLAQIITKLKRKRIQ